MIPVRLSTALLAALGLAIVTASAPVNSRQSRVRVWKRTYDSYDHPGYHNDSSDAGSGGSGGGGYWGDNSYDDGSSHPGYHNHSSDGGSGSGGYWGDNSYDDGSSHPGYHNHSSDGGSGSGGYWGDNSYDDGSSHPGYHNHSSDGGSGSGGYWGDNSYDDGSSHPGGHNHSVPDYGHGHTWKRSEEVVAGSRALSCADLMTSYPTIVPWKSWGETHPTQDEKDTWIAQDCSTERVLSASCTELRDWYAAIPYKSYGDMPEMYQAVWDGKDCAAELSA